MRVVGGILVRFNFYRLHSRRETIHKKIREATEEVREAGDVYPPVLTPLFVKLSGHG